MYPHLMGLGESAGLGDIEERERGEDTVARGFCGVPGAASDWLRFGRVRVGNGRPRLGEVLRLVRSESSCFSP